MQDTLTLRQLQSLVQVSNVINTTLEIDTIIDSIMIETISVVEAAGGGSLWLYDEEQGRLIAKSAQGLFYPHIFRQIRLKPGESMTGQTFSERKCLFFANAEKIKEALSTLTPGNRGLLKMAIPNNFRFTSVICSPIMLKGKCIGVITLDSFEKSLHFKQEDIHLLEAICHQAAIALEKSSLYQEKEAMVRKLSHSIEIHRRLAELVLNGEGIQAILYYLYSIFRKPTLLFDEMGELISSAVESAFSADLLNLLRLKAAEIIEGLDTSHSVVEIEFHNERFQLVALSLGSKPKSLGLLVILSTQRIAEVDLAALEHACTVISLELLKEQEVKETQARIRGEFVHKLFSGQINETIIHKAKMLNFDPNRSYIVTIIELSDARQKPNLSPDSILRRLLQLANLTFLNQHTQGIAVRNENQIVVLISYQEKPTASTAIAKIKELAQNYLEEISKRKLGIEVSIGIGGIKHGLVYIHKSFTEATKSLEFVQKYDIGERVLSYADLGVQRFIFQNSEEELMDFVHEVLGALIEYEQSRKGELLLTLFVYLQQNQNIKKTAEILHIHSNTLLYRLKRIEEILQIDLANSKQLFNIHIAINIYQYVKERLFI